MARHMTEPVKTFAIGFSDEGGDNELADARFVAETLGTDHHELELSYESDVVDLPDLLWHLDEPVADLSALGFHALSRMAAEHVTVALSGQGADELFGGYRKHRAAAARRTLAAHARPGRDDRSAACAGHIPGRATAALAAADPVERLLATSGQLDPDLRAELVPRPPSPRSAPGAPATGDPGDARRRAPTIRCPRCSTWTGSSRSSTTWSTTSTAPRWRTRSRFASRSSTTASSSSARPSRPDLKIKGRTQKYLLKHAARGLVPTGSSTSASAASSGAPRSAGSRRRCPAPSPTTCSARRRAARSSSTAPTLERLLADYRTGKADRHVHLLIAILLLEIWLTTYLPRAVAQPSQPRDRVVVG